MSNDISDDELRRRTESVLEHTSCSTNYCSTAERFLVVAPAVLERLDRLAAAEQREVALNALIECDQDCSIAPDEHWPECSRAKADKILAADTEADNAK